ncbi:MAG: hypothetical protein HWN68_11155 [Desulfobacterales bacterium]|nr:hypothetical protein [Desulfobacterales bacterium]
MIYLDTETKKITECGIEKHRMNVAWTCYVERRGGDRSDTEIWKFWEGTYPFCEYLDSLAKQKTALWVFGHNVFFDFQASDFFYYFTKWGWLLDFVFEKGKIYILVIHKDRRTIRCVSTTNYFDTSLKELGKVVGLEKLDVDFETSSREELITYCRRDVEIIKLAMERYYEFIKIYDLGRFSLTRASQAFNAYRHRFMDTKIYIHTNERAVELERKAYMGGRVECFRFGEQGGGPFVSLDINSMFPYIMKNVPLPVRLVDYRKNPPLDIVTDGLKKYLMIAHVSLDTGTPLYAVYRSGKVVFPTGRFKAYVCTPLLTEAMSGGHLVDIHELSAYEPGSLFGSYVDFFYALKTRYKQEANPIYERMAKIFLNSLYGKFAQWKPKVEEKEDLTCDGYWRVESIDLVTGDNEIEYKLFNKIIRLSGREVGKNSLVAIAAHITEWARFILWSIIEEIGIDKVLYCDTDSIKMPNRYIPFVKYPIDPYRLGALRVESEFEYFNICGAKSYITEHERRLKGVPLKAEEVDEWVFQYSHFPRQATHMRDRILRYHKVEKMLKVSRPGYDKGELMLDGSVRPYAFSEF